MLRARITVIQLYAVALLAEGVDRNTGCCRGELTKGRVALLAEGVDRNRFLHAKCYAARTSPSSRRAWIEIRTSHRLRFTRQSPSSRRAWIEMWAIPPPLPVLKVALLAEGVDRNIGMPKSTVVSGKSPSSRRAWIEIEPVTDCALPDKVALLAEGVDRNCISDVQRQNLTRRPPRGGRG